MTDHVRPDVVAALVDAHTQLDEKASLARLLLVEADRSPTVAEAETALRHEAVQEMPLRRAEAELIDLMAARRAEGGIARRMFPFPQT